MVRHGSSGRSKPWCGSMFVCHIWHWPTHPDITQLHWRSSNVMCKNIIWNLTSINFLQCNVSECNMKIDWNKFSAKATCFWNYSLSDLVSFILYYRGLRTLRMTKFLYITIQCSVWDSCPCSCTVHHGGDHEVPVVVHHELPVPIHHEVYHIIRLHTPLCPYHKPHISHHDLHSAVQLQHPGLISALWWPDLCPCAGGGEHCSGGAPPRGGGVCSSRAAA